MVSPLATRAPWLVANDIVIALQLSRGEEKFHEAVPDHAGEVDLDLLSQLVTADDVSTLEVSYQKALVERAEVNQQMTNRIKQSSASRADGETEEADTLLNEARRLIDDYGIVDNKVSDLRSAINSLKDVLERR